MQEAVIVSAVRTAVRRAKKGNLADYRPEDMGAFRAPTLYNIALTAPYMHDGSVTTLEEVVEHYAAGGRLIESGAHAGDGRKNPYKSDRVAGLELEEQEKRDLVEFLKSLTDEDFVTNPRFSNPRGSPSRAHEPR